MIVKSQIEEFFVTMLENCACPHTSYLSMPDNDCFTFCIREIKHALNNSIKNNLNNNYSKKLISNFYRYMQADTIFCKVDSIQYKELMLKLKTYSEGEKVSKQEQFTYFEYIERLYGYAYKNKLHEIIIESYDKPEEKFSFYYNLFKCFINELLASGINYKYLYYILRQYKKQKFDGFLDFIDYLHYGKRDGFDIFLPIKNVLKRNLEYLYENGQQIEQIDGKYYCKVYANKCIDFYYIIKQNISRIEAMFNMLRLYSKSKIDFEYEDDILVNSQFFENQEKIKFSEIICYKGIAPYYKHLERTLSTLEKLKEIDRALYHKVLNIISYAEKDKDICNHSSYVDNWISLETLCSLSGRENGYDAVEKCVPQILVARVITGNITDILKKSFDKKHKVILEKMIEKSIREEIDFSYINNIYYQFRVFQYMQVLRDVKKLKKLFDDVEYRISMDLLRIYMLRNEYVHESNIHAFNSMQQFKLKDILSMMLDVFFKTLNNRIDREYTDLGLNYEIFTQLFARCEARNVAFRVLTEKNCKVGNGIQLSTTLDAENMELNDFILNILKANRDVFRQYI